MRSHSVPSLLLIAFGLIFAACDKAEITTTRVDKGDEQPFVHPGEATPTAPNAMQALPGMAAANQAIETPSWEAPTSWEPKPLGSIRKGSWNITGADGSNADASVTVFPGNVGGDLSNINRWLGQIGQPSINTEQLTEMKAKGKIDIHGYPGFKVFLKGSPQSVLGALIPHEGKTWFVKIIGDTTLLENESAHFDHFLETIRFP